MTNPSEYTRLYIKEVAGKFQGGISEVRTGHMTQDVGMLTRMGDRFSTWEINNGLQSIIPTLLTSGLIGYPFILGDMIGGNEYFAEKVDKELMVRWAQASSLMPSLQFSVAPWDLDYQTEMLVSSALDVRRQFEGLLLALTQEAAEALSPICRPLWMLDPYDSETFCISDQFALGDHVIVAPVVTKNATTRDVYLTKGVWRELNDRETLFEGGQWLRGLSAPLEKLPCFVRVDLDHPDVNLPR
jgi:alpha-glucosidase (family GH31 glycosyl hydrolase)